MLHLILRGHVTHWPSWLRAGPRGCMSWEWSVCQKTVAKVHKTDKWGFLKTKSHSKLLFSAQEEKRIFWRSESAGLWQDSDSLGKCWWPHREAPSLFTRSWSHLSAKQWPYMEQCLSMMQTEWQSVVQFPWHTEAKDFLTLNAIPFPKCSKKPAFQTSCWITCRQEAWLCSGHDETSLIVAVRGGSTSWVADLTTTKDRGFENHSQCGCRGPPDHC